MTIVSHKRKLVASTHETTREQVIHDRYAEDVTIYWHILIEYHEVGQKAGGEFIFRASGYYARGGRHLRRIDVARGPITKYSLHDIQRVARDFFDGRKISSTSSKIFFSELAQFKV